MKKYLFVLGFLLPLAFAFAPVPSIDSTCGTPQNVEKTSSTLTSITFEWDAVGGAAGYRVYYERVEDSYTSSVTTTTSTTFTFSNLSAGTYKFHFATDCGGTVSADIVIADVVPG